MDLKSFNVIGHMVAYFVHSKVTPLLLGFALFLGVLAIVNLPREEEPQISVPMFDIFVQYSGASSEEVEKRIVNVAERKLWEIPGVEYIYSTSQTDQALIIVRFKVGEDVEKSLIKLYTKVHSNLDFLPIGASQPLIKVRSIDDVPILALTFFSQTESPQALRKVAALVQESVNAIPDISQTQLIGGRKRVFHVHIQPQALIAQNLNFQEVSTLISQANVKARNHHLESNEYHVDVMTDGYFQSKGDLENLVVGTFRDQVVYLKDIASVVDGPDEEEQDVQIRFAQGVLEGSPTAVPAVTLAVSKRQGANATRLCEEILKRVEHLKPNVIPTSVQMKVTRDYGETAAEKSNELLFHMGLAIAAVSLLIALVLGFKEAGVVAVAIPVTLALTLASFYAMGFTLNRITLFALIFSIGILVDDPIVDVENIVRHLRLPANRGKSFLDIVIGAVNEVQSPLILATLTVVAAILPMAFVQGLMGPYMRPIPIGSSLAMLFSMMAAFIATPWAAYVILKRSFEKGTLKGHDHEEDGFTRLYRSYMRPLIYDAKIRKRFLQVLGVLLVGALTLVPLKAVKVKMLPFDNKDEFQVILDMPEGTAVEQTVHVLDEIASYLSTIPEVDNIQSYAGTSAPYNFNGLVRHYYLREASHQGDLQVNLKPKNERRRQSHEIAKSVRAKIHDLVQPYHGHVQVAEVPPGPPVLATLVTEIYGPDHQIRRAIAQDIEAVKATHSGVTDVATYEPQLESQYHLLIDQKKASLNGISNALIVDTMTTAIAGKTVDLVHLSNEPEPVGIILRLSKENRVKLDDALSLTLLSKEGVPIALKDFVQVTQEQKDLPIYHKNLLRVSYVLGDVAGAFESPVYVLFDLDKRIKKLKSVTELKSTPPFKIHWTDMPASNQNWAVKFDGEWQITFEVFRDLGIAFAVVLILIYVLIVGWFQSFELPVIIMLPIPLTLVGILPAHWLTGMFFTATSMIGMIAGAGIVVRNSIILVDFIQLRLKEGMSLEEAVIDAGATRFRPMLLTALAVVIGASVILFDPIFQGLALSLMAGEIASTLLSRTAIPVIYYMVMKRKTLTKERA